ncbi:TPA: glycosyltransferase family 4 protein [Photobacterium damselae]
MKIVNISPIWFHKGEGISEVVINHHLSFLNLDVESKLIQTNYYQASKLPINNVSLFNAVEEYAAKPKTLLALFKLLYCNKDAIFMIHGLFQLRMLLTIIFLFLTKQNYVIIPHSSLSSNAFKNNSTIKRVLYRFVILPLLRKSKFVMYLNKDEKDNGIYNYKNVEIFPNGVTINEISFEKVKDINKAKGEYTKLIYLGRYDVKHKGLDYLLSFSKYLIDTHPEFKWELNMYGSDSKSGLEFISKYKKDFNINNLIIHDAVFGDKKDKVLSSSDIFILTSRYEGMPIAVLEALRNGLPCLLTKETNMLTMLQKSGVAEEFYCENFEKSFESLLNIRDKQLNSNIENKCLNLVKNNYSWDVICQRIVERLRY